MVAVVGLDGCEQGLGLVVDGVARMQQLDEGEGLLRQQQLVGTRSAAELDVLGVGMRDIWDPRMCPVVVPAQHASGAKEGGGADSCEQDRTAGVGRHDVAQHPIRGFDPDDW